MADRGPAQPANSDNGKLLVLRPVMPDGADLFTDASQLPKRTASRSENLDTSQITMERRRGKKNLVRFITPGTSGASRTFGTTGKYMTIPAAAQLRIGYGGFALLFHVVATRAGATGQILYGQDGSDSTPPFDITLSSSGVLTATVNWDGGGSDAGAATVADGLTCHCLFIYDPVSGLLGLYVNGVSIGDVSIGGNKRPVQTASMAWHVGAKKAASAVVTLPFAGKVDSMTLMTLAGTRPAGGTLTLVETLRRHSARAWPVPQMDSVLMHYDLDEASGATAYDRSNYKNHATHTGAPSVTSPIDLTSAPVNLIASIKVPDGGFNLVHCFGTLNYEQTSPAAV